LGYGVKYRAGGDADRSGEVHQTTALEFIWLGAATFLTLSVFAWGAFVFVDLNYPPLDSSTVYVVGKQWMWKVRHATGIREINELHVPINKPVRLLLTSQDVIHSFFVPAFRTKQDALPGMFTSMWFKADTPGVYHLFCAEYCGSLHAQMRGRVVVMDTDDFQKWLTQGIELADNEPGASDKLPGQAPHAQTSPLARFGCHECHSPNQPDVPRLAGLFGRPRRLLDGRIVRADEAYLLRSILDPNAEVPDGFAAPSTMPSFAGQLTTDDLIDLVESIRTLTQDKLAEAAP
jgi:cytochrome c oxidase subunit 2